MKVVFRTDASLQIGTGHVMRCLTLANALRERGAECRFVCREHPGNSIEFIRESGFEAFALPLQNGRPKVAKPDDEHQPAHADWVGGDWKSDAEATVAVLDDDKPEWLIVDHYGLDAPWESALRSHCRKLMVIDDLADRQHDCDLLLDQNLVADMEQRYDGKLPDDCSTMLGPDYALLQPQYAQLHPRTPPREGPVKRIFVYFGGADTPNVTGLTIAAFLSLNRNDIAMDVVINPDGLHADAIREQIQEHPNIALHTGLPSLAPLMVKADLAIGGSGATSWERCCLALPSLVITLAENQKPIAAELDRQDLIRCLGHHDELSESNLAGMLRDYLEEDLDQSSSEKCRRVVDGKGAQRVRARLMLNEETRLNARLARLGDESVFLEYADNSLSNKGTFRPSAAVRSAQRSAFKERMRDIDHCRLYVVETSDGVPVAHVSFEKNDGVWTIAAGLGHRSDGDGLRERAIVAAIQSLRSDMSELIRFSAGNIVDEPSLRIPGPQREESLDGVSKSLTIAVCSDAGSWINDSIPKLILSWLVDGHSAIWAHSASDIARADLCFYFSYGRIVDSATLSRFQHNLVVHASNLPKGRGWSPASWLILEGARRIPVTLIEAVEEVDAGPIYLQRWLELDGTELIDDWRELIAEATVSLSREFIESFPAIIDYRADQAGKPTRYVRRRAEDSRLDENKTLAQLFDQLRIADNDRYPAFFSYRGKEFFLKVFSK